MFLVLKLSLHIDALISSFQLKELARNFLTNFENAPGHLLQLDSRQSGNERRLIEVLVHFFIVMKCLPQNRLLQPFANLACNPAVMTVRIIIVCAGYTLSVFTLKKGFFRIVLTSSLRKNKPMFIVFRGKKRFFFCLHSLFKLGKS